MNEGERMKNNKGFTFLEIIISVAILAIISIALLSSMAGQFKLIKYSQDITLSVAAAQQTVELLIQNVKTDIRNGTTPAGRTNYTVFAGKTYQRTVGGYPRTCDVQIQKSTTTIFTIIADYTMTDFPVATASVSIHFSDNSVVAYQGLPSLSVVTNVSLVDPDNVNMTNTYRWYVSRTGFNSPMISNPSEIESGRVYPVFPDDYTIIPEANTTYLSPVSTLYAGRHLICTVTPASRSGKMGSTAVSNPVFVSGLPVISNLMLHLDASMISAGDADDILHGAAVEQWGDISGNTEYAAQTNTGRQPILANAKIGDIVDNGMFYETYAKCLSFDNTDDTMLTSSLSSLNTSSMTVFLVIRNAGEADFTICQDNIAGKPLSIQSSDKKVFIGYTSATGHSAFDIAEILIYNGSLSSADRLRVNTYLQNKYLPVEPVISIYSLHPLTDTVLKGENYVMPAAVPANMSNGTVRYVDVDWLPAQIATTTEGLKESIGTAVQDHTKTTTLKVNVVSITGLGNLSATVERYSAFSLPTTATATLSDGSLRTVDIKWPVSSVNTNNLGAIVITGEAVLDSMQHLTLTITVVPIRVTGVSLNKATTSIVRGMSETLIATVAPSTAGNKTVSWSTSNSAVATVSSTGVVTGVMAGTATITATTADGGFTASCVVTITVSKPVVTALNKSSKSKFSLTFDKNISAATINVTNVSISGLNTKIVVFTRSGGNFTNNTNMTIEVTSSDGGTSTITVKLSGSNYSYTQ